MFRKHTFVLTRAQLSLSWLQSQKCRHAVVMCFRFGAMQHYVDNLLLLALNLRIRLATIHTIRSAHIYLMLFHMMTSSYLINGLPKKHKHTQVHTCSTQELFSLYVLILSRNASYAHRPTCTCFKYHVSGLFKLRKRKNFLLK